MIDKKIRRNNLKIATWNANSISNRINEIQLFLTDHSPDVLLIQETFLKPQAKFKIPNYETFREDRTAANCGGTAILIKEYLDYEPFIPEMEITEATFIKIKMKNGQELIIGSVYHQPDCPLSSEDYDTIFNRDNPVILGGDFNAKDQTWGNRKTNRHGKWIQTASERHLFEIITPPEPTFYRPNTEPDFLDIFLVKNITETTTTKVLHELSSDHLPVIMYLGNTNGNQDPDSFKKTVNWVKTKNLLKSFTINTDITTIEDLQNEIERTTRAIQEAISLSSVTIKTQRLSHYDLPSHIKEKIRKKNATLRRGRLTGDPELKRQGNVLTQELKVEIKEHNEIKWSNFVRSLNTENQSVWKTARALTKHQNPKIPTIEHQHRKITTTTEKVEIFATSLEDQFRLNDTQDEDRTFERRIDDIVNRFLQNEPRDHIRPTTVAEITGIINGTKKKKAPGGDNITNKCLKELPENMIEQITIIINAALKLHTFPETWKNALVILIHKKGKSSKLASSYRPISLLSSLGKILEKIILYRMDEHTEEQNIVPEEQFGFRKEHSTIYQTTRMANYIQNARTRRLTAGASMLDISKAFDRVWHNGLLAKMLHFDYPPALIKIIASFLANRKFQVRIEKQLSSKRPIRAGVPQGSPLSPALYNIYSADMPKTNKTQLYQYADDTAVITTAQNQNSVASNIQTHLKLIEYWCKKWKVEINADKTQAIIFTNKRKPPRKKLRVGTKEINWAKKVKYLGVVYDKKLIWKEHIQETHKKGRALMAQLYPLIGRKSKMPLKTKLLLYNQIIVPGMLYSAPAWGNAKKYNLHKIQVIQNKCLRTITNAPWFVRNKQLHEDLNVKTIHTRIEDMNKNLLEKVAQSKNALVKNIRRMTPLDQ